MKIRKKLAAAFAVLSILLNSFPVYALDTQALPEKTTTSDEAPAFSAKIEYSSQGYIVNGTFTDFALDDNLVQPLYSLDGKNYQNCGEVWGLRPLDTEDEDTLAKVQYQIRLFSNCEPLKSYLAEELDCFYLKLRITRENGNTYETQPAVLDRGKPQPIPEGLTPGAKFSPAMSVLEIKPFSYYGRYHLTVSENATAEEISACLPNTLPVTVDFEDDKNHYTDGVVNCPVKWKSLSLPELTAGESVTIADAAEEIVVPKDTLVTTPNGIFRLAEPLNMNQYAPADEVRLVLNVISEGEQPTGVLSEENTGLEMSFQFKPTGATAIRAYTCSEGDSEWTEIPNLSLLETVNASPSTPNSDYTLVLHKTQDPYRSYLEAQTKEDHPEPFFIGLKIEGGVYDGKELILAWPDTYESPVKLPDIGGSGGNHNNAGTGDKGDSTESGQRPNLPHSSENNSQTSATPEDTKNNTDSSSKNDSITNEKYQKLLSNQENKPKSTARPDDTENHTESGNRINRTADEQQADILPTPTPTAKPKTLISAGISDNISNHGISSNQKEEQTDKQAPPDRATESKSHEPLVPIAVTAAFLCIAGFCFAAASGKFAKKNDTLQK